jgi:hypothetical protein
MDSGSILCFHYSFSCSPTVLARLFYAVDVYPLLSAGKRGKGFEIIPSLGAVK